LRKTANLTNLFKEVLPRWSPDGRFVAITPRSSGTNQLWLLDMNSGNGSQLTALPDGVNPSSETAYFGGSETAFHYEWSPDGKTIAFSSQQELHAKGDASSPKPRILQNNNFYATTPPTCSSEVSSTGTRISNTSQMDRIRMAFKTEPTDRLMQLIRFTL